jgi:hypothetical protein
MNVSFLNLAIMALLLIGLPPLGVWLAGRPLWPYLEFPPLTRYVEHAPFSWVGFWFFVVVDLAMIVPFLIAVLRTRPPASARGAPTRSRPFPLWGWAGIGLTAVAWVLAWSRFAWFQPLQAFTFSPLWLGYIVVVNALTVRRTGHCMMRDRPGYLLLLFPASAALWWFFEYLNRFVQNWFYMGITEFGAFEYALYATPPFATVLPAVLGTKEWLESFPRLQRALRDLPPVPMRHPKALAWGTLFGAGVGLSAIGLWPDVLYPLVWVAPLLIITSLQAIQGQPTIFSPVSRGDWRPVYLSAMAALVCGFFWEMWNFFSAAKWVYTVPYVYRYLIFEMPVMGYGGYLPFGLECAVVGALLPGGRTSLNGEPQS